MNRFCAVLAALFGLLTLLTVTGSAQPKLKIVEGEHLDFGVIYTNEPIHRSIHLVNEGTDTLKISAVSASCGCTTALASAPDIPPKGKGEIAITFDPERFNGMIKKAVSFDSNDPKMQHAHLEFTVLIDKVVTLDQSYITFPNAPVDSVSIADLVVRNLGKKPIKVKNVSSTSDILTVDPASGTIAPDESLTIKCKLHPKERGIVKGNITVETDNQFVPRLVSRFYGLARISKAAQHN